MCQRDDDAPGGEAGPVPARRALYTVTEAAEMLAMSASWLQKEIAASRVAHTRLGRAVRFSRDQIEDIVSARGEAPRTARRRRAARTRL